MSNTGKLKKFTPSVQDMQACVMLLRALYMVDPSSGQFWYDHIKACLDYFDLPDRICDACEETKMTFLDYHMSQGMCDKCAEKYSEKVLM